MYVEAVHFVYFYVSAKPTDLRVVCAGERAGKQFEILAAEYQLRAVRVCVNIQCPSRMFDILKSG